MIFALWVLIALVSVVLVVVVGKWFWWQDQAEEATKKLADIKARIKKRNTRAVELELATSTQIFQELSKRGKVILLLPHKQNDITFVETLAAQLSPSQTMDVLRVAYTGIADHLVGGEGEGDGTENNEI